VKPRDIARAAITAGWLTGMALILDGLPLWAAIAVVAAVTAGAVAWVRWGTGLWLGLRTAVKLRNLLKRAVKTGDTLERA
jgi:hypothetical protein